MSQPNVTSVYHDQVETFFLIRLWVLLYICHHYNSCFELTLQNYTDKTEHRTIHSIQYNVKGT